MKDLLAAKDTRLEELEVKVTRLEEKDLQHELLIKELLKEREIVSAVDERSVGKSVSFPRTCRELRASDPTLTSGMHWIDPDGQGVGDDPIFVYCDMAKGILCMVYIKYRFDKFYRIILQVPRRLYTTANRQWTLATVRSPDAIPGKLRTTQR